MNLGLCTIAAQESPVEAVIATAGDAGYDGVEIWGKDHVGDGAEDTCREIRGIADRHEVAIAVYGSYLRPGTDAYEDDVEHELDVAERLGAPLLRVWAGDEEYQDCSPSHWDDVVADLTDLAGRAADRGIGVTVEKHAGTVTNREEGARRLIRAVDRENCGLNWQPLFGVPADELLAEARALAPLSNNVHVQAVPSVDSHSQDRCPLSEAYFDVPAMLEAFEDAGFEGYVEVEFVTDDLPFAEAASRDRRYLAPLAE